MTNRRGRPERTGTQRPKHDVYEWIRDNPEIKSTKLHERLLIKRESIIRDSGEEGIDDIYYVPSRQHIHKNWVPEARKSLVTQEVQELLKTYSPMATHNSPYWLSNDSPYTFTLEDKAMLIDVHNWLKDFWFNPLEIYENEFNVNVAMWICIVSRTQPRLNPQPKPYARSHEIPVTDDFIVPDSSRQNNPIDTFLVANYLAKKYLVGLQAKTFPIGMAPTETVSKPDLDFLMRLPYSSKSDWNQWENLSRQGIVNQPQSHWYTFLQEIYKQNDTDSWFNDFPMNWSSQIDNLQWLPPYQKARYILANILRIFVLEMNKEYKDDVSFMKPQDDVIQDKTFQHLHWFNDIIKSIADVSVEKYGVRPVVIDDNTKVKESSKFKFNTSYFVKYLNLLYSLDKIHQSEQYEYTGFVTMKRKELGGLKPLQKAELARKQDFWFDGTHEAIVDIEIDTDMMFEVISPTQYYNPGEMQEMICNAVPVNFSLEIVNLSYDDLADKNCIYIFSYKRKIRFVGC